MQGNSAERRVFKRKNLKTNVYFEDENGDRLFYVTSRDISLGGIFIEGDMPLRTGSLILISFELPNHKRLIKASGEVVRKMGEGVGIRFAGLGEQATKWIEDFLS